MSEEIKKAPEKSEAYKALEKKFEDQLKNFKKAVYIPNPYLCHHPKFIFIGMEPSVSAYKLKEEKIEFLTSFKNFILHKCAYTNLCDDAFEYHFTDVSKLAMESTKANKKGKRDEIYEKFYPLLSEEIEIFSKDSSEKPILITNNTTAIKYLNKNGFNIAPENYFLHWGKHNSIASRFENELRNNYKLDEFMSFDELKEEIDNHAIKLMNYLKFEQNAIDERFNEVLNKEYTDYQKNQLVFIYHYFSKRFDEIKMNSGK